MFERLPMKRIYMPLSLLLPLVMLGCSERSRDGEVAASSPDASQAVSEVEPEAAAKNEIVFETLDGESVAVEVKQ